MSVAPPRISIITPSFNNAVHIEACIQSVMAQSYRDWEHIVVDGGSSDGTIDILKSYSHLRWISEPDRGQAHALNKGFEMAQGRILAWLNADDTYLSNAFAIAARELDAEQDRYVIVGRCAYIDEDGRPTGLDHPRVFQGRRRLLQIWRGYTIPQPAVFFMRDVLDACGNLDEDLHFGLDYELFLRFSEKFYFHAVDARLANYRLHPQSKTSSISEDKLLEIAVDISRRYWGPPDTPLHLRLALSHAIYQRSPWKLASRCWRRAGVAWRQGSRIRGAIWLGAAFALFPPVPLYRYRYNLPALWSRLVGRRPTGASITHNEGLRAELEQEPLRVTSASEELRSKTSEEH